MICLRRRLAGWSFWLRLGIVISFSARIYSIMSMAADPGVILGFYPRDRRVDVHIFSGLASASHAQVCVSTASRIGGWSLGYTTKSDLTGLGSFPESGGIIGLISSDGRQYLCARPYEGVMSVAGVGIFAGDGLRHAEDSRTCTTSADDGSLSKEGDHGGAEPLSRLINMFQFLLYLMGKRR